ncbi:hypothetical protein KSP39_PZI001765 [Platanthera zijinensis]|uniref:Chromo domain-containing protein n=1 Tax=Platanthera zijinensis TaxID=2320716 RepID=A0AAP0BXU0_9ASPA
MATILPHSPPPPSLLLRRSSYHSLYKYLPINSPSQKGVAIRPSSSPREPPPLVAEDSSSPSDNPASIEPDSLDRIKDSPDLRSVTMSVAFVGVVEHFRSSCFSHWVSPRIRTKRRLTAGIPFGGAYEEIVGGDPEGGYSLLFLVQKKELREGERGRNPVWVNLCISLCLCACSVFHLFTALFGFLLLGAPDFLQLCAFVYICSSNGYFVSRKRWVIKISKKKYGESSIDAMSCTWIKVRPYVPEFQTFQHDMQQEMAKLSEQQQRTFSSNMDFYKEFCEFRDLMTAFVKNPCSPESPSPVQPVFDVGGPLASSQIGSPAPWQIGFCPPTLRGRRRRQTVGTGGGRPRLESLRFPPFPMARRVQTLLPVIWLPAMRRRFPQMECSKRWAKRSLSRIGDTAYTLDLPSSSRLHPNKPDQQVIVQWKGLDPADSSWERRDVVDLQVRTPANSPTTNPNSTIFPSTGSSTTHHGSEPDDFTEPPPLPDDLLPAAHARSSAQQPIMDQFTPAAPVDTS